MWWGAGRSPVRWRDRRRWSSGGHKDGGRPVTTVIGKFSSSGKASSRERGPRLRAFRMIEILLLGQQHGPARLRQAIEEALRLGCSDAAAVRYLLTADELEKKIPESVEVGSLISYERALPTMEAYDQLVGEVMQ